MAQRVISDPPAGGEKLQRWRETDENRGRFRIREKVSLANNGASAVLAQKLPANCRIIHAEIRNKTAITVPDGGAIITPDGIALVNGEASTITETATTKNLVVQTTLTANARIGGTPQLNLLALENSTTSETELTIVPIDSGGAGTTVNYYDTAGTAGAVFSGTADVWVEVYGEEFDVIKDAS